MTIRELSDGSSWAVHEGKLWAEYLNTLKANHMVEEASKHMGFTPGPLAFDDWLITLEEVVIEQDYGYEPGEFTVFPEHWRPMWAEGLTPADAFQRALDAHGEARREDEAERLANWKRIQAEDRAAISQARGTQP